MQKQQSTKDLKIGKGRHLIWKQQKISFEQTYHQISKYILEPQSPSLHTVIELSRSHMSQYKYNMIILSGLGVKTIDKSRTHVENRYCTYSNIEYGKNVRISSNKQNGCDLTTIELERMKIIKYFLFLN